MSLPHLKAVIVIVSDTASANPASDACAPLLRQLISSVQDGKVWEIAATHIVPDDVDAIQNYVKGWTDREEGFANLIVTSGGTGFAGRDVTPEAIESLLEKNAGGLV
jgi:gephyrin